MSKLVLVRAALASALTCFFACDAGSNEPAPPAAARVAALTVDLWRQGAESAAPAPLPSSDVTHIFEHVNGSNSTGSTTFTGRVTGPTGGSGVVHSGAWSVLMRGTGQHPNSAIPVYTGEVRKRIDTSAHRNVRLTYWRRLVGFEPSILNGAVGYDRLVVRYATVTEPGPSDWTEAHAITNGAGGVWTEGVVDNLPASSTLWISFQADLRPRLNTSVSPSVYQFDEWIYLDDFLVTGDTGCASDVECDDIDACTTDTCNVATGECEHVALPCSDGLFCNGFETCDALSGCVTGVAPVIDDGSVCTADSCDETNDVVLHTATPGVPCPEGFCDAAGACMPYVPTECDALGEHAACGQGASWCQGSECVLSAACGDGWLNRSGIHEPIEECDDGNNADGDACSAQCESTVLVAVEGVGGSQHAMGTDDRGGMLLVAPSSDAGWSAHLLTQAGERARPVVPGDPTFDHEGWEIDVVGLPDGSFGIVYQTWTFERELRYRVVDRNGFVRSEETVFQEDFVDRLGDVSATVAGNNVIIVFSYFRTLDVRRGRGLALVDAHIYPINYPGQSVVVPIGASSLRFYGAAAVAVTGGDDDGWAVAWSLDSTLSLTTFWNDVAGGSVAHVISTSAGTPVLTTLPHAPGRARYALAWTSVMDGYARVLEVPWDANGLDPAQQRRVTASTSGTQELNPSIAPLGRDALVVSFTDAAIEGRAGLRVLQRGESSAGVSIPEVEELLAEQDVRGDLTLTGVDRGTWLTWIAGATAEVRAYLLPAPDYALEPDSPGCFNTITRIPPPAEEQGGFGIEVAAAGDAIAVSENYAAQDVGSLPVGAAHVYRRQGRSWAHDATLWPDAAYQTAQGSTVRFGDRMWMSDDLLLVQAGAEDHGPGAPIGAMYVFQHVGGEWLRTSLALPGSNETHMLGEGAAVARDWIALAYRNDAHEILLYRRIAGLPADSWQLAQTIPVAGAASVLAMDADSLFIQDSASGVLAFALEGESWLHSQSWPGTEYYGVALHGEYALARDGSVPALTLLHEGEALWASHEPPPFTVQWPLEALDAGRSTAASPPYFGIDLAIGDHTAVAGNPYGFAAGEDYVYALDNDGNWQLSGTLPRVGLNDWAVGETIALGSDYLVAGAATFADYGPGAAFVFSCEPYTACGDGWLSGAEQCDDGNRADGDACPSDCNACIVGSDTDCDGIDDDCDGAADDDFVQDATTCGLGACASAGQLQCSAGSVIDTCISGPQLAPTDVTCDGVDDDCDGAIDDECACTTVTSTVAEHAGAARAFACSTTPVTFFSEGFESGTLSGWSAAGNASANTTIAHAGAYSAQLAGTGLSTLRRTISTAGLSSATLSVQVRTRGPLSAGYYPAVRHSTNGGSSWTQLATHPGPLPAWSALSFSTLPLHASLTLSFEASPTETTRFVHFDSIAVTGTCSTPAWFANGSNAQLGTSSSASVTLYNLDSEPGVWRSGSCPVSP